MLKTFCLILLIFVSCTEFSFAQVQSSVNILEIKAPDAAERVAAAGIFTLPKVTNRQVSLSAEQKKYYSQNYGNFNFKDDSRFVRGIPIGVTGIYAMDSEVRNDLYVYHLEDKSPARGIVNKNDIIIGANGRLFKDFRDCRIIMGLSIAESQTSELKGNLYLHLMRGGEFKTVSFNIGTEKAYAKSFPFNCERSKKIADEHIKILKKLYKPESKLGADWWNVLMLMASDDLEAQQIARRAVYELKEPDIKKLASWYLGYELIILSEYYLLTGDSGILPSIGKYSEILQNGMFPSGSWGHGLGFNTYGEVNASGLTCFMGLALAKKCGVKINEEKFKTSFEFFKKFRGYRVPYGDNPTRQYDRGNNGKSGMAAVAFSIAGDKETSSMFAVPSCYSYDFREGGHAEGLFNFAWGPLGAIHATQGEYELFMNNMLWYYELSRKMDGSFEYFRRGRFSTTQRIGGMALFLMMPGKKLQILNADTSVFAMKVPSGAEKAAQLYKDKKWAEFSALARQTKSGEAGAYINKLYRTFEETKKIAAITIESVRKCISEKKFEGALNDYISLEGQLGANWPGLKELKDGIDKGLSALVDDGKKKRRPGNNVKPSPGLPEGYESTRDRRRVILNGWVAGTDYIANELSEKMNKMPIADVIRHTIHPHETFTTAAYMQILERKNESRPLIEKLLQHKDYRFRAAAVQMLGAFEAETLKEKKWNKGTKKALEEKKVSPELASVFKLLEPLLDDKSLEVQLALVNFLNLAGVRDRRVDEMILKLSKSKHPIVVSSLLTDAPNLCSSTDFLIKAAVSMLAESKRLTDADINKVTAVFSGQKEFDFSPYFDDIFKHLNEDILYRKGIAPDSSYGKFIKLFHQYPNHPAVQKNIKLFCHFYVLKYLANIDIRILFEKMDRNILVPQIKEFVSLQTQWLAAAVKNNPQHFKVNYTKEEYYRACLEELTQVAAELEKGQKIDHGKYDKWADQYKYMNMMLVVAKHNGENKKAFQARMKEEKPKKDKQKKNKSK